LVAVEHFIPDQKVTLKGKVSSKFDLSLAVKFPSFFFKDIATSTLGVHGSNLHTAKRQFKAGLNVEFNV